MPQSQQNISVSAPGFNGLNTQDSPVNMDISFAAIADNCIIDKEGRIGTRKSFQVQTTNYSVLESSPGVNEPVEQVFHFTSRAGVPHLFVCGNGQIFLQDLGAPYELVPLTLPTDYVILNNNWSICTLSDWVYFVQAGQEPLKWNDGTADITEGVPADPTELYPWANQPDPTTGPSPGTPDINLAAFGHQWCAGYTENKSILVWSDLLIGDGFGVSATQSGSIDLTEVWPMGYDEVTAMYAQNNFLVVFGQKSILVFAVPQEGPVYASLSDTVSGIGCLSRDTVVGTGNDVFFLDASGVRSLGRTITEKSLPIGDVSMNVRSDIKKAISQTTNLNQIKAVYQPEDSFYAIFFPSTDQTYVFDTRVVLQNGASRATRWPGLGIWCGTRSSERITWFAGRGGVYLYQGSTDIFPDIAQAFGQIPDPRLDGEIREVPIAFKYYTNPQTFDSPANLKFPKQLDVTMSIPLQLDLSVHWAFNWDTDPNSTDYTQAGQIASQYNISEYTVGEYSGGESQLITEQFNLWGSGRNVNFGFEAGISGAPFSIQEINIQTLIGRIV